ncbi:type IV secretion protein IcmC [Legionella sp. km772]|uniref:type IV secretion protein IcmC n=1 Tax=Legionella sp. km772 TaxID=2498111 RepID=UPI000F8E1363|nr:type IV secretion protein IcmC [Legionella sp. km772]RUR12243.1 type IV secretion protein IcmC [Legionella sp. km772]
MACTGGTTACWLASQANILNNVANSMPAVEKLVTGAAYLIGLLFVFKAIATLRSYGESRTMMSNNGSMKEPLIYLASGAMLIYFPTAFKIFMQTSFGYENVLQYAPVNSPNNAFDTLFGSGSAVGEPLSIIIQVIGVIAFVRGWVLIARASGQGQQPGGTGKGLMHVCGGILAMNIVGTLDMINNTLYGT